MQGTVAIGDNVSVNLKHALYVYSGRNAEQSFVTLHDVTTAAGGGLVQGPPKPLTSQFLKALLASFRLQRPVEVLPENVLAYTDDILVWWTRPAVRQMFFAAVKEHEPVNVLSGKTFPHPALLFAAVRQRLYLFALDSAERPTGTSLLFQAPYWNVDEHGSVCLGSTPRPNKTGCAAIDEWEANFFASAFTHPNGTARYTRHTGGYRAMLAELAGKKKYPVKYLVPSSVTLHDQLTQLYR